MSRSVEAQCYHAAVLNMSAVCVCLHVCVCVCAYVCMSLHLYVPVCVHMCSHACVWTCVSLCVCMCACKHVPNLLAVLPVDLSCRVTGPSQGTPCGWGSSHPRASPSPDLKATSSLWEEAALGPEPREGGSSFHLPRHFPPTGASNKLTCPQSWRRGSETA